MNLADVLETYKREILAAVQAELAEAAKRDADYRAAYDAAALRRHQEAEANAETRAQRMTRASVVAGVATGMLTRNINTQPTTIVHVADRIVAEMEKER